MTHPLDGARRKIERAERQIKMLGRMEETFRRQAEYLIVPGKHYPAQTQRDWIVHVIHEPSLDGWGVCIGEIAHDLTSALDNTVWQLALLRTKTPAGNTGFPVFLLGATTRRWPGTKDLIPHFNRMGLKMIRDLSPAHRTLIERLQPYKRGRGGKRNALYQLREINNADKHRLIQVVGTTVGAIGMAGFVASLDDLHLGARVNHVVLKEGAVVVRRVPDGMHVNSKFTPLIAFAEGCEAVRNGGVCHTLSVMAEQVRETVESFGPEFP